MDYKYSKETSNKRRPKKRKFGGNQFTSKKSTASTSASAKKLSKNSDFEVNVDQTLSYCIVNFGLFLVLQDILICKMCKKDIKFSKRAEKGLGFSLSVQCKCDYEVSIPSSPKTNQAYEINRRIVFSMRLLGVGLHGINTFLRFMDIGKRFTEGTYYYLVNHIHTAVKGVTQIVLSTAVKEEQDENEKAGNVKNHLAVSGDGSWAKRGFSSLIGIASLIGKYSKKIIDISVKSSICKACEKWCGKENTIEYSTWYKDHKDNCNANHDGSAGAMEVESILEMFKRSKSLYNVWYEYYIGDGDTKTFKKLLDVSPYGDEVIVKKKECVLHVKKRMFKRAKDAKKELTQLKKLKSTLEQSGKNTTKTKGTNKRASAKTEKTAQLTNTVMQELSTFYGLAVLRNANSVDDMRTAIWATYYHKCSTDANPQHTFCPEGTSSWCKYRKAEADNTLHQFKHPPALHEEVQSVLKPIYDDLSSDDLLKRCVGANTQNSNESYNGCVWHFAPKHLFSGKKIVEIAAWCAACKFNEGLKPFLKIMEVMGITIGKQAAEFVQRSDEARVELANKRSSMTSKENRTTLRNIRLQENDAYECAEGIIYGPGIAD
ncbi:hypothetical protein ALC62_01024 [Cyphomyrmex costatus]|uniref:Mutator-like transposase domain-containing protein n=1 Tax=Cyphomyrmex costatus TaxID=456900 RepID=A0A151IPP7_9HYME|nr:hypothetical protein ALC62_01024 [Cyphomyrmex costatus]